MRRRLFWNGLVVMLFCGTFGFLAFAYYQGMLTEHAECLLRDPAANCEGFAFAATFALDFLVPLAVLTAVGLVATLFGYGLPPKRPAFVAPRERRRLKQAVAPPESSKASDEGTEDAGQIIRLD